MTLNKRYRRNIKKNFSFYFSMTLLTLLAVFMNLLLGGIVKGEKDYLYDMKDNTACEDGQFITYQPLSDDDIITLEKDYDVVIEKQEYFNFETSEKYRFRVFKKSDKLDQYQVMSGDDLSGDSVLISSGIAERKNIKVGDSIEIGGKSLEVKGIIAKIDYLLMLEELSDTVGDENFGIAVVSSDVFTELKSDEKAEYYSIAYNEDNQTEFRKHLNEEYGVASYLKAENNARIVSAFDTVDRYDSICTVILPVMIVCIVILMAVVIGRKIKAEQRQMGVLLALGYGKGKLALHYTLFGIIPGLVGSVLGILLSVPSVNKVGSSLFSQKIEPLTVDFGISAKNIILSLILPALVYGIFVWLKAFMIMRKNPIDMIRGTESGKKKNILRMEKSKSSIRTRFMLRSIFGNIGRTLVVIFGVSIGGMMLVYSYVCADSMQTYVDNSIDEAGTYNYEYFLSSLNNEPLEEGVELVYSSFEVQDHDSTLTLIGVDDTCYLNTETNDGGKVDSFDDGFYITTRAATEFGVEKGDTITVLDVSSMEEHEIKVAGVLKNNFQNVVYTSRKSAAELAGFPEDSYNAVMSDKELNYTDADLSSKVTMQKLKDQMQSLTDEMSQLVYVMIAFGVLFCVITVYLMVNILITENASVISMLKILGYRNNEINRMTTHVYHCLIPIGILLGLAIGYKAAASNFVNSVASYHVLIEPYISVLSIVKYVVLVIVSYIISLVLLRRKVKNSDMAVCLRNNNE